MGVGEKETEREWVWERERESLFAVVTSSFASLVFHAWRLGEDDDEEDQFAKKSAKKRKKWQKTDSKQIQ